MSSHPRRSSARKRIQEWQRVSDERDGTVEPEPRPTPPPKPKAKRRTKPKPKPKPKPEPKPEPRPEVQEPAEDTPTPDQLHDAKLAQALGDRLNREQALIRAALDYTQSMDASDRQPTDYQLMQTAISAEKELRRLGRLFNTSETKSRRLTGRLAPTDPR